MKRSVTWTTLAALMFSQGFTMQCLAAEVEWTAHMDAYRAKVLAPAAAAEREKASAPAPAGSGALWSQICPLLLLSTEEETESAAAYIPWRHRRGPAYPDDKWRSFGRDVQELPATVWDDTKATFTDPTVLIGMLVAGAAGITINATGVDETVAGRTDGHRQLSKSLDGIGGFFGSPAFHFPLAALMYGTGLAAEHDKTYEVAKTLMNALIINGASTVILKLCCRTSSPNGDENGWPSGHTSSSFTVATVLYKAYGPWVGVPALAFASFVGYQRIDARNHDFSDVVSGMILGIVIAHAVARNHDGKVFGMDLAPFVDPNTQTVGLQLSKSW